MKFSESGMVVSAGVWGAKFDTRPHPRRKDRTAPLGSPKSEWEWGANDAAGRASSFVRREESVTLSLPLFPFACLACFVGTPHVSVGRAGKVVGR